MEDAVRHFFARYERVFNQALRGQIDDKALAGLYATEFIAAAPAGVRTGRNDDQFRSGMIAGYEHYRAIGTKTMQILDIHQTAIDALHVLAQVSWRATYLRKDQSETMIDFTVHYLVQLLAGVPKVFGWISGDEEALLRQNGIL